MPVAIAHVVYSIINAAALKSKSFDLPFTTVRISIFSVDWVRVNIDAGKQASTHEQSRNV